MVRGGEGRGLLLAHEPSGGAMQENGRAPARDRQRKPEGGVRWGRAARSEFCTCCRSNNRKIVTESLPRLSGAPAGVGTKAGGGGGGGRGGTRRARVQHAVAETSSASCCDSTAAFFYLEGLPPSPAHWPSGHFGWRRRGGGGGGDVRSSTHLSPARLAGVPCVFQAYFRPHVAPICASKCCSP